jgi:TolA-binding protein
MRRSSPRRLLSAACLAAAVSLTLAPRTRAELSEQDLPAQGPSAGTTPSASPSPSNSDWERLPSGAETSPQPGASAGDQDGSAPGEPSPEASSLGASDQAAGAQPTPSAPPPALDIGAIAMSPDLANASLEPEIAKADSPALAASLRYAEEARKELDAGKIDEAIRGLSRAISIDPGDAFAYFYLGRAYLLRKNYDQAGVFFMHAEIGFGARPEWLGEAASFEGACDEVLGRADQAEKAYQQALASSPNNLMARVGYDRLAATNGPIGSLDAPPPEQDLSEPSSGWEAVPAPAESPPPPPPESNQ